MIFKMLLRNVKRKTQSISLRTCDVEFLMFRMSTSLPAAIRIFNQSDNGLARVKHMINTQGCSHFASREHSDECK